MTSATISNSNETHLPFPVHRLSVAQFQAFEKAGLLAENDRVELLEGVIVPKTNSNPRHSATVHGIHEVNRGALPQGWCVRLQDVVTTDDSQPEPDLAVVSGTHRDYADPTGPDSEPAYRSRRDYSATDTVPLVFGQQEVVQMKAADMLP